MHLGDYRTVLYLVGDYGTLRYITINYIINTVLVKPIVLYISSEHCLIDG